MAEISLYPHQEQAIAAIEAARLAGQNFIPTVMATGTGKTTVFSEYARRFLAEHAGWRVLIIAHTDELVTQAAKRARLVAPHLRVGIVKAGQDEHSAQIIVASRQTLASPARRARIRKVGLIIIDECHHAVKTNTYGKILDHFTDADPALGPPLVLGFTATLARGDKAKLSTLWGEPAFTYDILSAIRNGFLLDVTGERIIVDGLDFTALRTKAGDFSESDIADELERTYAPEVIANEYVRLAKGRRGIAFWPLVDTAYHGERAFEAAGLRSGVVHGAMDRTLRKQLLQRFALPLDHPEAIEVMHNAMVLTEGFDEPTADIAVIARPTRSAPLYQQMVGRVLRPDLTIPARERKKALVLDVTGTAARHDLATLIDLSPEIADHEGELDAEHSLLELADDIQEELDAQRAGATYHFESDEYAGPATTTTFDPLSRAKVWGTTLAGHHFISVGTHGLVFLAPSLEPDADPGTWDVIIISREGAERPFVYPTEHRGLPLDMALNFGEGVAEIPYGAKTLTSRTARWRKGEPSAALKGKATRLGIDWAGKSKGELSDLIDIVLASRRIDPVVEYVTSLAQQQSS